MSRQVTKSSSQTVKAERYAQHRVARIKLELERAYTSFGIDLTYQMAKEFYLQVERQHRIERPHLYEPKQEEPSNEEPTTDTNNTSNTDSLRSVSSQG